MRKVLEVETDLGSCDQDVLSKHNVDVSNDGPYNLWIQSTATLNGTRHMLRIEHTCFLKAGEEFIEQPWIRSDLQLEPVVATEEEMRLLVQQSHDCFLEKAKAQLPADCLIPKMPGEPVSGLDED